MAAIGSFFTALLAKIVGLAKWFLAVFAQVFKDVWNMATDLGCWFIEGLLSVAADALSAIDVPFNPQTYYSMIPADVGQMLGAIGITQSITIIVAALVIRFVLQAIPFVRWGS
ncbi:DUF2523 family protein [Stutzerimonas stutzeri]|uniref:DUF2523 family protein n=1 Tax=Stutzerimonas stutzeri TaxID=316 RepID=UPI001BCDB2BA|nr:DUF2523 family protein [Stutzerimonas stutzeri]